MPGKTPRSNGQKPVENGVKKSKDAESGKSKSKKATKDGDEEMTVVVPPSKATKQSSAPPPADADGDVSMSGEDKAGEEAEKVDPAVQAVAGEFYGISPSVCRFRDETSFPVSSQVS
jgi:26S proteasome regulatory subunit N3